MKNKGFTLAELLAVITILSLLILIAVVSITTIVNNSKNQVKEEMIKNIKDAAISYGLKEGIPNNCALSSELTSFPNDTFSLPSSCYKNVNDYKIKVSDLIEQQYFKDISDKVDKNTWVFIYKVCVGNNCDIKAILDKDPIK